MSSFYYWIPNGKPSIALPELLQLGLGYALEGGHTARGCDSGPDKQRGAVVCQGANKDGRLGYFPEKQTWKQIPGKDVWCGYYTEAMPTPEELARDEPIPGVWIELDGGGKWQAPIARKRFEDDGELFWSYNVPRRLTLDEGGEWVPGEVKPRYQRLWADAERTEQAVIDGAEVDDLDAIAIRALQINYRVSAIELDLLGIYDESLRVRLVHTLIDLDTWLAWVKKKTKIAHDGVSS